MYGDWVTVGCMERRGDDRATATDTDAVARLNFKQDSAVGFEIRLLVVY